MIPPLLIILLCLCGAAVGRTVTDPSLDGSTEENFHHGLRSEEVTCEPGYFNLEAEPTLAFCAKNLDSEESGPQKLLQCESPDEDLAPVVLMCTNASPFLKEIGAWSCQGDLSNITLSIEDANIECETLESDASSKTECKKIGSCFLQLTFRRELDSWRDSKVLDFPEPDFSFPWWWLTAAGMMAVFIIVACIAACYRHYLLSKLTWDEPTRVVVFDVNRGTCPGTTTTAFSDNPPPYSPYAASASSSSPVQAGAGK